MTFPLEPSTQRDVSGPPTLPSVVPILRESRWLGDESGP